MTTMMIDGVEEGSMPTAQQWLDHLLKASPEEQLAMAERAMQNAGEASDCLVQDHRGALLFARTHQCTDTTKAYRAGWTGALEHLSAQLDAKDRRDRAKNDH